MIFKKKPFWQSDVERHTLAKYLMELTLVDYNMVHYHPSELAAAALCLSQQLLEGLQWVSDAPGLISFRSLRAAPASPCASVSHTATLLFVQ